MPQQKTLSIDAIHKERLIDSQEWPMHPGDFRLLGLVTNHFTIQADMHVSEEEIQRIEMMKFLEYVQSIYPHATHIFEYRVVNRVVVRLRSPGDIFANTGIIVGNAYENPYI